MRHDSGRWVVFGVLVFLLGGILVSHWKKQDKEKGPEVVAVSLPAASSSVVTQEQPKRAVAKVAETKATIEEADIEGYYPSDPQSLKKTIRELLKKAAPKKGPGELVGLIVPHAAVQYSGKVAADAFKQLDKKRYETVVILIPSHEAVDFKGIVICPKGKWVTPLGSLKVDQALATRLQKESSEFEFSAKPFQQENALDVQLPFLQVALKEFEILPIMIGGRSSERAMRLADALRRACRGKKVLFLATTHLSRGETYATAKRIDFLSTSALEQCDANALRRYESERLIQMCGYSPVLTLLYLLQEQGVKAGTLLSVTNSADVTGNKEETIVGYTAMAFYKEEMKK